MQWWNNLVDYFERIGRYHHVNPVIYVAIHFVVAPLFAASVGWIVRNRRKKLPIAIPACVAIVLFNISNLYLIVFGNNIPFWIYAVAGISTIVGAIFTIQKIRKRTHDHPVNHPSR